jgi:hypothetical protein
MFLLLKMYSWVLALSTVRFHVVTVKKIYNFIFISFEEKIIVRNSVQKKIRILH